MTRAAKKWKTEDPVPFTLDGFPAADAWRVYVGDCAAGSFIAAYGSAILYVEQSEKCAALTDLERSYLAHLLSVHAGQA